MTTKRYLRIVAVLAGEEKPIKLSPLTAKINRHYEREYPVGLIGLDLRVLVFKGWVVIDKDTKALSLTQDGLNVDTSSLSRKPRCVKSQQGGELMLA